ncbi:hypothetical protein [Marininema halotolerans]|uniref:Uncharacterized protein n=1 Tax=Marininema halotolerans TaxID=1155944 RepID=A0A1I6U923_9BACL|nr:hypothetical protein [Marininema halotolerans]SFS97914.1 hypothetical protein SAMN05444972_11460 [Marininema halotolerans]
MKTWIMDSAMNATAVDTHINAFARDLQGVRLSVLAFSAVVLMAREVASMVFALATNCLLLVQAFHGVHVSKYAIPASTFSWLDPFPDPLSASS